VTRSFCLFLLVAVTGGASLSQAASTTTQPVNVADRQTLALFAGAWWGHTRRLMIARDGRAEEHIDDGCCTPVIDLEFRLSRARGTWRKGTATATVTRVRFRNRLYFTKAQPAPRVGATRTLRLRDGLLIESLTKAVYCNHRTRIPSRCGA
jgi:hypothetical protein